MVGHRWSGWPGAWCLDCGQEDLMEVATAIRIWNVNPVYDKKGNLIGDESRWLTQEEVDKLIKAGIVIEGTNVEEFKKLVEANAECKEPGSKRCDPYAKLESENSSS